MSNVPARITTNYNSIKDLVYITSEDLNVIEINAALLDLPELYSMLFIEAEHLTEAEVRYTEAAHLRGKKKAIANASDHLFARMKERNGTAACVEFLQNCGKFSIDAESSGSTSGNGSSGFAFNVFMPGDKSEGDPDAKLPAKVANIAEVH